uniref:ABC1 atypical kinase-like domain-containing protein n=1 Tax=Aegilops tauschii subsp. strangulata TaxID=200361 RepID=A0A453BBG4_AEGTS
RRRLRTPHRRISVPIHPAAAAPRRASLGPVDRGSGPESPLRSALRGLGLVRPCVGGLSWGFGGGWHALRRPGAVNPMLRLLSVGERLLTTGTNRRAARLSQLSHASGYYATVRDNGLSTRRNIPPVFSRMFSHYKDIVRKKVEDHNYRKRFSRGYGSLSGAVSNSSARQQAQLTLKRPSHIYSYSGPRFPLLSRAACALTLSLTRSHIIPGVVALAFGKMALSQPVLADSRPCMPKMEGIVMRTRDTGELLSAMARSVWEGITLFIRAVHLAFLFFPATALAPFADSLSIEFRRRWLSLVRRTLEKAGPAFIKWGQWAATRPDLFPSDLCVELAKLHSGAPVHGFAYSKASIEKAFGRKLSEIFETFEENPVASGSIAQIHRATLKDRPDSNPTKKKKRDQHPVKHVAVKVRHPGVGESIKKDFLLINFMAKVSNAVPGLSWLRLDESVRQFAVFMMSQVDLSREASNLHRFRHNFRRWRHVSFPEPLYPLVHPAVLIESFENGESVARFVDETEGNSRMKKDLAHIGTYAFLKMLLEDNFIHADMHPGNILVRLNESKNKRKTFFRSKPHIVFLDVGMTAELSVADRDNLKQFFKAVAIRDGRTAAKCTLRLSDNQSCPNPAAFTEELDKTFTFWGTPEGDVFHPVECMHQLLDTVRRHKVNIDGNICTVMVTILVLEGVATQARPTL